MQHFTLGFLTGLLVWLSIFIIYRVKGRDFPAGPGIRFLKAIKGSRHVLNALYWGVVGGIANVAIDIDFLLHQWLGFPYRFWHTPALILGAILAFFSVVYIWRTAPNSRRIYTSFLVLVVGVSFITHVLEDYLLGWF
jgi:hypothetical protein